MPPHEIKPGHFYIAPKGTLPFADGGWEPIGHASHDGLIVDGEITADRLSAKSITAQKIVAHLPQMSAEALELYYGVPQRHLMGIDPLTTTQESHLSETFTNNAGASITVDTNGIYSMIKVNPNFGTHSILLDRDLPKFLRSIVDHSVTFGRKVKHITLDGKPSIKAGEGGSAGIVYKPTTQDQADRNLNFALANLEAHVWWETTGKAAAEAKAKADAELAEAKAKIEREREANLKRIEKEAADGLAAYNKSRGTAYTSFNQILFMGSTMKREWIEIGKQQAQLRQEKEQVRKEKVQNEINKAVISPLRAYDPFAPRYNPAPVRPWL